MIAKDYYFFVQDASKKDKELYEIHSNIAIVNIDYWNSNHHLDDHHLMIEKILPSGISEEMESVFSSEYDVEETRRLMLEYGFLENSDFSNFISNGNLTNEVDY